MKRETVNKEKRPMEAKCTKCKEETNALLLKEFMCFFCREQETDRQWREYLAKQE